MYTHINRDDRAIIADSLRHGESYSRMSKRLGKDKGAIWREVQRNKDEDDIYRIASADRKSRERRLKSKQKYRLIENNNELAEYVENNLEPLISPEVIAHQLRISPETIYAFIYRSRPDLKDKLPQRGKKRRRYGSKRGKKIGWTQDVRSIHDRVEMDENWEGDTIKGRSRSRVLTHVERKSLYTIGDLIPSGEADSVHAKLEKSNIQGTITYDRGSEFSLWRMIERDTGVIVYFADAHHPGQRGKNENTNGRLRRVYPKKFDFDTLNQRELDKTVWKMNHTPRKSLSWQTPCVVYGKCCNSS